MRIFPKASIFLLRRLVKNSYIHILLSLNFLRALYTEYAYTLRVNEKSDIYSFGVVILELVTGKLPIDPEFGEKDLVKWICTTLEQKGTEHVFDPKLDVCFKEEMGKVLNIGLLCASALPIYRPSMRRVVKMLQDVSPEDKSSKSEKKNVKLSP